MLKTLPFLAFLSLSRVAAGIDAAQQCAEDVIALMQEDKNVLGHALVNMIKAYNKTCEEMNLCTFNVEEDTLSYLSGMTEEDNEPELPEVPIEATVNTDFGAFDHASANRFMYECNERGGFIKFYDVTLNLDGTAVDLVDVKIVTSATGFPMCLVTSCKGVDPEEAFEYAVKHAIFANAPEISDEQKTLINGMSIAMACAASGVEKCDLRIVDSDDLTLSAFGKRSSGSVAVVRRWGMALMTLLGVWFAVA